MPIQAEKESAVCLRCGYPSYAGHASNCPIFLATNGSQELLPQAEIEKYNTSSLPFESVNEVPENITWNDFDQDQSGKNIYLYRGLENTYREMLEKTAAKSNAASMGETREEIFERFGSNNLKKIAKRATGSFLGSSPILHTTRNRFVAEGPARNGFLITYKIPKDWLLQQTNRPISGNIGEAELDFFYEIPPQFVEKIEQLGKEADVAYIPHTEPQEPKADDVIKLDNIPPSDPNRPYNELP